MDINRQLQDTQDSGWKLCPGPVGQQVDSIGGIDEEEGIAKKPQMDGTAFVMRFKLIQARLIQLFP